jgi:hypothetical protein
MIKRNGGVSSSSTKTKIPHPRNQTRPRRSPREIPTPPRNSSTTKYPARRPEKQSLKKLKWSGSRKRKWKNIHTFREFYQDIVKDIIIKTAKTYRRSESQSRTTPRNKQTTTKTKTKPSRPAARIKQAPKRLDSPFRIVVRRLYHLFIYLFINIIP